MVVFFDLFLFLLYKKNKIKTTPVTGNRNMVIGIIFLLFFFELYKLFFIGTRDMANCHILKEREGKHDTKSVWFSHSIMFSILKYFGKSVDNEL